MCALCIIIFVELLIKAVTMGLPLVVMYHIPNINWGHPVCHMRVSDLSRRGI